MRKAITVIALIAISSALVWAGGSSEAVSDDGTPETTVFRAGIQNPDGHPLVEAMKDFAEILKEKSDGRYEIEFYAGGQLGDHRTHITSMQTGALDVYMIMGGFLVDMGVDVLGVMMLPFLFDNVEHARAVQEGPIGQQVLDSIQEAGTRLVGIGMYQEASRHFFFTRRPVTTIDEMRGLKIRVQPGTIYERLLTSFGSSVVPVSFGELYSALQTGVVDGAEQPYSGFYANRFHEVSPYFLLTGHETSPNYVLFSELTWNRLSEEDRALIVESFNESVAGFNRASAESDREIVEKMLEAGVEILEPADPQEWQDAAIPLYEEFAPDYGDLIEQIRNTSY